MLQPSAAPHVPQHLLGGLHVAILATDGFEQSELADPLHALQEAGVITKIVAPRRGAIQGFNHDIPADTFAVDLTLDEARADDFDAVLLPGGERNAAALRGHEAAQSFVRQIDGEGKPVAAICHAPWLLISAGLVEGRTLTSVPHLEKDVCQAGGRWVDEAARVDDHWVTSRTPRDIPVFNERFMELLARRTRRSVVGTADEEPSAAATGG